MAILFKRLPNEYQEVEYIESTTTQFINTGVYQSNKATVDCHFYIPGTKINNYMFGDRQSSGSMMYNGLYGNHVLEYNWIAVSFTASNDIVMTQRISGSNTIATINGQTFTLTTGTTSTQTATIYIFGCNNATFRSYGTNLRCYYFKMYDDNVLLRDFVPCFRKSDGVIGMYDTVDKTFYTNQGTGTFLKGPSVYLPNEYQEVEYITSSGTQYIKTGITNTSDDFSWEFDCIAIDSSGAHNIYGSKTSGKYNYFQNYIFDGVIRAYQGTGQPVGNTTGFVNVRHIYKFVKSSTTTGSFYIDGTLIQTRTDLGTSVTGYEDYIFACNYGNNAPSAYASTTLYYAKLWQGTTLVRHYIPCYLKSNTTIGLYDLVTSAFYPNNGTGTFTKGADKNTIGNVKEIIYNGNNLNKFIKDGVIVWEKPYTYTRGTLPTGVATLTCNRTTTKEPSASTGVIVDGDTIYFEDTLTFSATAASGYNTPTVSNISSVSGNVTGASYIAAGSIK